MLKKTCIICGEDFPLEQMAHHPRGGKVYAGSRCSSCHKRLRREYMKEYYAAHKISSPELKDEEPLHIRELRERLEQVQNEPGFRRVANYKKLEKGDKKFDREWVKVVTKLQEYFDEQSQNSETK